ncbi:AMP-binding enzyme [Nitzschia inconspicua]|uniref:AMP-binding enzyme n=1 Tax=Nitzschia inconspicua TaxID=303405 RepID=A0A9K3LW48_9STRA|nr:AMP-binding enzyme [Nitzschia inconspicua]
MSSLTNHGTCAMDIDFNDGVPAVISSCQSAVQENGVIIGSQVGDQLRSNNYTTLLSVIPKQKEQGPAFLCSIDGRCPVRHTDVHKFIQEFGNTLHGLGIGRGHRVALCIPNGVELALGILAVSQWATCVPLSSNSAGSELIADLERCGADLVIGPYSAGPLPTTSEDTELDDEKKELAKKFSVMDSGNNNNNGSAAARDWTVHHHVEEIADQLNIPFVGLVPSPVDSTFRLWVPPTDPNRKKTRSTLRTHQNAPLDFDAIPIQHGISLIEDSNDPKERFQPNTGSDEALVLFTSGTTGNKKLVPHFMGDILTAALTIALSWELQPNDVNCNLMPLFHVGGILRQVYAPLVSGGAVICCPSFDADLFWSLLKRRSFNWYYAAPTMHQIILQTGKATIGEDEIKSYKLKMIANAAGGLLPSLANEMRQTYAAAILPSYGMTECMPISSPPATYDLSKPGTSGVPVGPEVGILNLSTMQSLPPGEEGPICVRGEPCFRGYGVLANDPDAKKPESFLKDGWFNTGDLGFLDKDGYLYITGRSKEVINRGGEIIPPMEVEEACIVHPDIQACAAFAAAHDVLQETVGLVVVTRPGRPRSLDLPTLHAFIADKLATPKWPQCLIFMEGGLPKSHTNKLLRVKLGERLGLPEFSDSMSTWERTFEADCPPQGTPLEDPIPSHPVQINHMSVQETLRNTMNSKNIWIVPHPQRPGALVAHISDDVKPLDLVDVATERLHRYEVPTHICRVQNKTKVSEKDLMKFVPGPKDAVASLLNASSLGDTENDPMVEQVQTIFLDLLKLDYIPPPTADFFQIGGSSMTASQLASKIRKTFNVSCTGAEVFHHSTSLALVDMIRSRQSPENVGDSPASPSATNRKFHQASFPSSRLPPQNSFIANFVQLLPMFVVFPIWQISRYLLFFGTLLEKSRWFEGVSDRDFTSFLLVYIIFHILWVTFAPLVFIAIKWIVIGRYKPGRYAIWSSYYLRWWFVDVCRKLFLKGIWGSSGWTLNLYYRMLGAKIGYGAKIAPDCELAEFDLVYIGRKAAVELSTVRGFGVDNGCMILGHAKVGDYSSVGLRSVVAPNTTVEGHLGPGTSSYDDIPGKTLHPKHARVNRQFAPQPLLFTQLFLGFPLTFFVNAFAQIPPLMVTYTLLQYKSRENDFDHWFSNWNELLDWLCDPRRIPFFFAIRIARALFSPFFYMAAALLVKKLFIGTIKAGPLNPQDETLKFRIWLAEALFSRKKVQNVTDLIGRHYESVSKFYRLLGAKVGNRVFWPGNQPACSGLYDLLSVGDDAVFGSRSVLVFYSVDRVSEIIICAGGNVSDNCIVMPGSVISKNAVLGSNSICSEGRLLPSGSVWFGSTGAESQCLEPGDGTDPLLEYDQFQDEPENDSCDSDQDEAEQPNKKKSPLKKNKMRKADMTNYRPTVIASEALRADRLQMKGDETTIRPVGRAVYLGKTKGYCFLPESLLILFAWANRVFCSVFHTMPLLLAVQFGAVLLYSDNVAQTAYNGLFGDYEATEGGTFYSPTGQIFNEDTFLWFERDFDNDGHHHTYMEVFFAVLSAFLFTHMARVLGWIIIELLAKWLLMGKRRPGRYNYDTSSYAMRWELYQLIAKIRKMSRLNLLQFISGTPYMNWYFRANGGKIGTDVCLYPAGADPMMPEPDMVKIGSRSVIDCASIVCHLNTRGNFELAPIIIGKECTLRTRSRVQQGVHMEEGSQLLEKSIAMTGEVLDKRSVWQGGPATMWFKYNEDAYGGLAGDIHSGYTPPTNVGSQDIEMGTLA